MEEPPPVPPKDRLTPSRMDIDRPSTAPSSGSKRKRSVNEDSYHIQRNELENIDPDAHSPKRNRSAARHNDTSTDEEAAAAKYRSLRRKKGMRNLSNLNLRHAAAKQSQLRESKFQEGSLNDKPSAKPPSVFMKMPRSESDNSLKVDEMMEDYHEDVTVPRYSTLKQRPAQSRASIHMETQKKDEGKGFFHFGRQVAASFNPASLWQRWWAEPKEDISQADEKARQKAEVDAKYAEMKKSGQFTFQTVHAPIINVERTSEEIQTPRDSAIEIDSLQNTRSISTASALVAPTDDENSRAGNEVPDTGGKQNKGIKSRLHFKKPSLSNLKDDLKRVKSDLNLGASVRHRESSSSVSPVKQDFENSALKRSQSRYDLKKTHKLSKRVSDLEAKLESAKKELDEALVDASPLPINLTTRNPAFKPSGTFRRSRFVPGKLPSLPSERILMAEQMKEIRGDAESEREDESRAAPEASTRRRDAGINEGGDTLKAPRGRQYPTRASTLFELDPANIEQTTPNDQDLNEPQTPKFTHRDNTADDEMDPNSIINGNGAYALKQAETQGYTSLDEKLKALEKNVKVATKAKQSKSKKRKSNDKHDKLFKPGRETDDDAEWEDATPKKKRKSGGNSSSPKGARTNGPAKQSPPRAKKAKAAAAKANGVSAAPTVSTAAEVEQPEDEVMDDAEGGAAEDVFSQDERMDSENDEVVRTSLESQDRVLGVVYEEEEEAVNSTANGVSSKSTTATRFTTSSMRSRSNSPHKRTASVQPGVEEQIMTRAALAAQQHPGRAIISRSISPPPANGYIKTTTIEETVTIKPGENGVPRLPKGANGSFESLDELGMSTRGVEVLSSKETTESFEWPDDVF